MSLLYCRTCSIGVCANAIGRPSASVRISAASGIVRTSPARSISRRFRAVASVVRVGGGADRRDCSQAMAICAGVASWDARTIRTSGASAVRIEHLEHFALPGVFERAEPIEQIVSCVEDRAALHDEFGEIADRRARPGLTLEIDGCGLNGFEQRFS